MSLLVAQVAAGSVVQMGIVLIVIIAVCGVVYAMMRASGVSIPPDIARILWICIIAIVAILALVFLARMAGVW